MGSSMPASGRHQRKLRNLLLDKKFQLKYAGYLLAIAAVLGGALGLVLWRASSQIIAQSARNAAQGQQIVDLGHEVVAESRKVRSEEHTSELQSRENLVCRLLLEKKKQYRDRRR